VFGGNGRKPKEPAPTQEHVPIEMVRDGVVVSRPLQRGGRVIAAVLRASSRDVRRMSDGEPAWSIAASTLRWFISCRLLLVLHPLLQRPHDLQIQRAAILASQIVEALLERTRHTHGDDGRFLFRWSCSCHTIIIATGGRTTSRVPMALAGVLAQDRWPRPGTSKGRPTWRKPPRKLTRMRSGLVRFDDDPAATLEEKVRALGTTPAAAHYEHK
jgi:hypothetical protein